VRITIAATPRTKKTSNRVFFIGERCPACRRGKLPLIKPSAAFEEFQAIVVPSLRKAWADRAAIDAPCRVSAVIYREALRGDLVGYLQALADLLQEAGVVTDDKWITSWDGSRMSKSAEHPRIELTIELLPSEQPDLFGASDHVH
jgi:hypothetical protein